VHQECDDPRSTGAAAGIAPYLRFVPRPERPQFPGGIYHVGTRGNRRAPIYLDDRDREKFLELLAEIAAGLHWRVHAYCLMGNHYHLVAETPNGELAVGMERLNGRYARWFNARYGFVGHLFERRYWEVVIESEWQLVTVARYLENNPVRAGLCDDPRDWPWSSHRAFVGTAKPTRFHVTGTILAQFGRDREIARGRYRRFVREETAPVRGP
jgi:REP-associated tyrosine transposase